MDSSSDTLEKYDNDYEVLAALQSVSEAEAHTGMESDELVAALITAGQLLNARGEYLDGLGYFIRGRGILELREEQLHPLMSELLAGIGEHYLLQGMLVEALPYYRKSLAVQEALCIGETPDCAFLHMKAGEILCMQGELDDAKEHILRSYQILKNFEQTDHFSLGEVTHNLGIILHAEGQYTRSAEYLTEAAAHRSKYYGAHSLERADSLWALGNCQTAVQAEAHALESFYEAITIREEVLGQDDPLVVESKDFYRSLSRNSVTSASETAIVEISDRPLTRAGDPSLISALLTAALVALEKNEPAIAADVIEVARAHIGGSPDVHAMTEAVLALFSNTSSPQ